jgi:hypothetical protein
VEEKKHTNCSERIVLNWGDNDPNFGMMQKISPIAKSLRNSEEKEY